MIFSRVKKTIACVLTVLLCVTTMFTGDFVFGEEVTGETEPTVQADEVQAAEEPESIEILAEDPEQYAEESANSWRYDNGQLTEELLDRLEADQKRFFDTTLGLFGDEYVFTSYFVFGDRDDIAGNEAFFHRYYPLESHVFHADMGHIMDASGAEKVADIIEKLEAEQPVYVDWLDAVMADIFRDSEE